MGARHAQFDRMVRMRQPQGDGVCFGAGTGNPAANFGGLCPLVDWSKVDSVHYNEFAGFGYSSEDGVGQCWGKESAGGSCPDFQTKGLTAVYAASNAFLAINGDDGTALCWGLDSWGGDCKDVSTPSKGAA